MYVSDPQASKRSTNTHQSKHDRPPTSSPSYASNASMGLKGTQVTHHPSRFSHQFLMMMIFIIRSVEILLNRNFSHAGFQILMTLSTQMLGLGLAGLTRRQVIPSYPRVPHLKPSNWHHSPWIGRQLRILVYPPMMVWPASLASVGRYLNPVAQEFFSGLSKFGVSDSTLGYGFMSQKHWTMCSTKSIILLPIVGRSVVIVSLWSSLWYESFFFSFSCPLSFWGSGSRCIQYIDFINLYLPGLWTLLCIPRCYHVLLGYLQLDDMDQSQQRQLGGYHWIDLRSWIVSHFIPWPLLIDWDVDQLFPSVPSPPPQQKSMAYIWLWVWSTDGWVHLLIGFLNLALRHSTSDNVATQIANPLITPLFAIINLFCGQALLGMTMIPALWYTNTWQTG